MEYTILNSNMGYNNFIVANPFVIENFIPKFSTLSIINVTFYLLVISAVGLSFYVTWKGISKIISLNNSSNGYKKYPFKYINPVNAPKKGETEGQKPTEGPTEGSVEPVGQGQTPGQGQGEGEGLNQGGIGTVKGKPVYGSPLLYNPINLPGGDCCCGGYCNCCNHNIAHKPEVTTLFSTKDSYYDVKLSSDKPKYMVNKGSYLKADIPLAWGLYFQDGATPSFEGIVDLHNRIMFYLVVILFGVSWVMLSIMWNFNKSENKLVYRYLNHGTLIELIWTVGPALVLVAIAFPSFKLLYLMDEVIDPAMTVKVTGHQWYWEYEYADFLNEENETINFDSYMKDEASLEEGELRMLEVDNAVVLPVDTHIRFIITGADVLHDWAVPALALKVDAAPGRLNQASVIIERTGFFYGQCSEICGVLHSSMPIKIEAVEVEKFFSWLLEQ